MTEVYEHNVRRRVHHSFCRLKFLLKHLPQQPLRYGRDFAVSPCDAFAVRQRSEIKVSSFCVLVWIFSQFPVPAGTLPFTRASLGELSADHI